MRSDGAGDFPFARAFRNGLRLRLQANDHSLAEDRCDRPSLGVGASADSPAFLGVRRIRVRPDGPDPMKSSVHEVFSVCLVRYEVLPLTCSRPDSADLRPDCLMNPPQCSGVSACCHASRAAAYPRAVTRDEQRCLLCRPRCADRRSGPAAAFSLWATLADRQQPTADHTHDGETPPSPRGNTGPTSPTSGSNPI